MDTQFVKARSFRHSVLKLAAGLIERRGSMPKEEGNGMSRGGRWHLVMVVALGLAISGLSFVGTASAVPVVGGPSIRDITVDDQATATPDDDIIYVAFDNGVNAGSLAIGDFVSTGLSLFDGATAVAAPGGFSSQLVTLTNLTRVVAGTDSIALSARGVITSIFPIASPVMSHDTTPHNINSGPILVNAFVSGLGTDAPADDVITLRFNVAVEGNAGGAVDVNDFIVSQLNGGEAVPIGDDDSDNEITIALNDAVAPTSGKTRPNATTVRLNTVGGATVRSVLNDFPATSQNPIVVGNAASGAFIVDATYNPRGAGVSNDVLVLVFSEDLTPGSFTTGDLNLTFAGGLNISGSEIVTVTENVVRVAMDNSSTAPAGGLAFIDMNFVNTTLNRAGQISIPAGGLGVVIDNAGVGNDKGPIITRVHGAPDPVGTLLTIEFSEGVLDATVQAADFLVNGDASALLSIGTGGGANDSLITLTLSTAWSDLSDGDYIEVVVASGIQSNEGSTAAASSTVRMPIRDGRRPFGPPIAALIGFPNTYEENPGGGQSIAHITWTETAGTDSADYYLLFTRVADPVDSQYVADNLFAALPVSDPTNRVVGSGNIVGDRLLHASINISPGMLTTEGTTIVTGDPITFGIVAVTYDNRPAPISASGSQGGLALGVVMTAGEVQAPIDFMVGVDDDMMHILGHKSTTPDSVYGDSASVEANARVLAFVDPTITLADTADTSVFIGFGQADAVGQVAAFDIGDDHQDPLTGFIYLFTLDQWGNLSGSSLAILNDNDGTGLNTPPTTDPFTPNKIYADGDSIVIVGTFRDTLFALTPVLASPDPAVVAVADFSQIDTGSGSDNVPFLNHGTDGEDNDGDWDTDIHDVGLDGILGTADAGEDDDTPTPGEYFCDIGGPSGAGAGNGSFDLGESFTDTNGNKQRDPGEPNVDLNDADEFGWYSTRWTIDPATSVTDSGQVNFLDIKNLPVVIMTTDCFENMVLMDGTDPFNRFLVELDNLAPSVSEILTLEQEPSLGSNSGTNVVTPGDNCYPMGEFIDLTITTPSDLDVDFVVLQLSINEGAWFDMSYDPNGDANGDGYPGEQDVDDDRDGAADSADAEVIAAIDQVNGGAPAPDGVDNDNDGQIDETTTDGIDNDDDGTVDDGSEVETYDARLDDNEDGIEDGVDRGTGRATNPQPHVLDAGGLGVPATTFDFFAINGFNIDMRHIRNLYGIDDNDNLQIRGVAYDMAGGPFYESDPQSPSGPGTTVSIIRNDQSGFDPTGNATPEYAAPICFTTNLEAPVSSLPASIFTDIDAGTAGTQICDVVENFQGGDPGNVDETQQIPPVDETYTLEASVTGSDVVEVVFYVWDSANSTWLAIGNDVSGPPFTTEWVPGLVDNDPAGRVNHFFLTSTAEDLFGNVEDLDRNDDGDIDSLDAQAEVDVVDCVSPIVNVTRIGIDSDLTNGAIVPIQAAVEIEVGSSGFTDRDEIPMYGDGADNEPGDAGVDDDGDGTTDERDFGFDQKPGTADDEWNAAGSDDVSFGYVARAGMGLDRGPGNRTVDDDGDGDTDEPDYGDDGTPGTADDEYLSAGSDDFMTNDVIRVDFQMRSVGNGGPWITIESITGTIVGGNVSDLIPPLVVTWDTRTLAPGDYDIRAQGFDIEGNTNDGPAFITTVKVDPIGLRAYIVPPVPAGPPAGLYNLYAHTYIHDILVDHVDFEFYVDDDADGVDNDGNDWIFIGTDDNDGAGAGGDILLRAGSAAFDPTITGGAFIAFTADVKFVDLDNDGYSSRDPIFNDANLSGVVDGGDFNLIGDISDLSGSAASPFPADHFYVGAAGVDPSDWIYQENAGAGVFNLWTTGWDARGLSGSVLVRAVATNEVGAVDDTTIVEPTVIPVEAVDIDATAPCATIASITLQDGTVEPPQSDTLDVSAENAFIRIDATVTDPDVASVEFQWSVNGGATWMTGSSYFDVNNDGDFYSDIDGTPGFSSGDEIFFDADGDFTYSTGDVATRFTGTIPVTPIDADWPILPLLGEDPSGSGNTDGDNQTDEDNVSSESEVAPHTAFLDLDAAAAAGFFATNTQVLFRAVATDVNGNVCPSTTFFKALIHERRSCRVDAIVVTTTDGDTVDVLATIGDGDGGDQLGNDTLTVFATANDSTTITSLRIFYRRSPDGYPNLNVFNNAWVDAGIVDNVYPYFLTWDISAIADGCYQFFVSCTDEGGNVTDPPASPYEFQKLTVTANIDSTTATNFVGTVLDTVFPGDEITLYASLSDPTATANAEVTFKYAERILDEVVTLTQSFPYVYTLAQTAIGDPDGSHTTTVSVTINGTEASYYTPADFNALSSPTLNDYTIDGGSTLRMGGQQTGSDEILISYNVTSYENVLFSGDREAPFTAAWDFRTGGVPSPTVSGVNAFDLIASVSYNYFDPFFTSTPPTPLACLFEEDLSEDRYIIVLNAQGPCPFVLGVDRDATDGSYPYDFNQPGNPMCLTGDKQETGLAGKEIDVFITVTDSADAGIDSVYALFDGEDTRYDFALYSTEDSDPANDSLSLPITMYITDYMYIPNTSGIVLNPDDVENVQLRYTPTNVFDNASGLALVMYDDGINGGDLVADDGCYTATPRLDLGTTYRYRFDIDLVGDQQYFLHVADARNRDEDLTPLLFSSTIIVPSEFWYRHFDMGVDGVFSDGSHQMVAYAVDANGNRRSNVQCPQGRLMFIVDLIAPIISMIDITPDVLNVCALNKQGGNGLDQCCDYTLSAMIPPNPVSIPALGVTEVQWQFTPDNGIRWITLATDSSATGGWSVEGVWNWDPADDNVDNDADGYFDEGDNVGDGVSEEQVTFQLRALAIDDCGNIGFSTEIPFTIDTKEPECELVTPADGSLFAYGSTIELCATSPDEGNLKSITFQYMDVSGIWTDIDWTPQDDSDPDYVPAPEANAAEVCINFDTGVVNLDGTNPFLWLRCVAADSACNVESDPQPILVQLYDASSPSAWICYFNNDCMPVMAWDPKLAVSGDDVEIVGVVIDPVSTTDVAKVTAQVDLSGTWTDIGVDFAPFTGLGGAATDSFVVDWNTDALAEGSYTVRVVATDTNGNSDTSAATYNVRVDRTNPNVPYTNIVFIDSTASYANDGVVGQSSLVILPDEFTGDVAFRVITPDSDIKSMTLQFRDHDPTTPGDWETFPVNANLDFESNRSSSGAYFWWTVIPDWADTLAALGIVEDDYEFRVLATDYACNTNALSTDFIAATIDITDPSCKSFTNNAVADGTIGQVAAGESVTLVLEAMDALTDVVNVWYDWSFDGSTFERIPGEDTFSANNIDSDRATWLSTIVWTTPEFVVRDKVATIRAHIYDSAGNTADCTMQILVEDDDAPLNTRIFDISHEGCVVPNDVTETTLMVGTTIGTPVGIVAATAVGDSGIRQVTFELSSNGGATWFAIGTDQEPESFTTQFGMIMPTWTISFVPEALDSDGNRITPDGNYLLRAWAVDLEENYELLTSTTPMRAPITIDTTPPVVKMNTVDTSVFDTTPTTCEATVERGSVVNIGGQTVVSAGNPTPTTDEDVTVTFWYMNAKDEARVADSWKIMNQANGIFPYPDDNDTDNPDENRPYSFYWNTALDSLPLTVGGTYNVVAVGADLVCNSGDVVESWLAGLGTCFTVTDTTAPCATIVYLDRDNSESSFIQWPDWSRVNRIDELTAGILRGDTDTERVDFYYRPVGSTTWILADGDLFFVGDEYYELHNWTSDNLTEGVYEFAANGIDDAGNADFDPSNPSDAPCSITRLVVDRTAPVITAVTPVDSQSCADVRYEYDNSGDPTIDVIFTADEDDIVFFNGDENGEEGITFEWKYSDYPDREENWDDDGFGNVLYDRSTGRYSTTFDVDEPEDDIVDFRVTVSDSAGNESSQRLASWVILDRSEPEVTVTRIVNLADDTTIDPADQGQETSITAGDPIQIWVTARDGSEWVPTWAGCGVDTVFFEVARGFEKNDEPSDSEFMPLTRGIAVQDPPGAFYADWNTTGLEVGYYWVRAHGVDCCGNIGFSDAVELDVESNSIPKVAVVCFDPDVINDINGRTQMRVYAREWCDQEVDKVIFEYRETTGAENGPWIPFGFTEEVSDTDSLWSANIDLTTTTSFALGDTVEFRAIAIKYATEFDDDDLGEDPDRIIDLIDDNPVVTTVTIQRNPLGTRDLMFEIVRTSPELINFTSVKLVPQTSDAWYIEVSTNAPITIPWVTVVAENDGTQQQWEETVRLYRSPSDPLVWRGGATKEVLEALCDGGVVAMCAAAIDSAIGRVDIDDWSTRAYKVTNTFGSNGPVSVVADSAHAITVSIPPGNGVDGSIVISPSFEVSIEEDEDQSLFLDDVPNNCYDIRQLDCQFNDGVAGFEFCFRQINETYPATITIQYSESDIPAGASESDLLPAYHDGDDNFHIDEIYAVRVDTTENTVTFKTQDLCDHNVYCLVVPKLTRPIVATLWPYCNGYTSQQPHINGTLTDIFNSDEPGNDNGDNIDSLRIRLWIDGQIWASMTPQDDADGDEDNYIPWARGNGSFSVAQLDPEDNIREFRYQHSGLPEDVLAPGVHWYEIQFATTESGDAERWFTWRQTFAVDATAPFVRMNGGTVGSPVLENVAGYVNASEPALTARLWDLEAGVFARPTRQDPIMNILWGSLIGGPITVTIPPILGIGPIEVTISGAVFEVDYDMGLKMDVWLIDGEDDEDDVDEFLDRTLIQAGTADMLTYEPSLQQSNDDSSDFYSPEDTLTVRFPITADLSRYDGGEIEVVLYTAKIEHIGHDIQVPDAFGDDDEENEEFTKYLLGAFDCVGNVGSAYTAARYIIDASAPKVAIVSPSCNASVAPGAAFNVVVALTDQGNRPDIDNDGDGRFAEDPRDGIDNDGDWVGRFTDQNGNVVYLDDLNQNGRPDRGEPHVDEDGNDAVAFAGAGIDTSTVTVTITAPNGDETDCPVNEDTFQNGTVRCTVPGPHAIGQYTISVSGTDRLGNSFSTSCTFQVEDLVLATFGAEAYPNPFDPTAGNVNIRWTQSRPGSVTIDIFDFAGDFVTRLRDNAQMTPSDANAGVQWGGSSHGGTTLANGGYLAHIVVNDGARTQSTDVKIAIRRESSSD